MNTQAQQTQITAREQPGIGAQTEKLNPAINKSPLEQVRAALRDLSVPASRSAESLDHAKPGFREITQQSVSWAKSLGWQTNTAKLGLAILENAIPLGIAYVSAKLVPIAVEISKSGEGLTQFNQLLGILGAAAVIQAGLGFARGWIDSRADARLFRNLHEDILRAGIALSPEQLDQPRTQNMITKIRENLGFLHQNVNSMYGMLIQTAGVFVTAAALMPISPQIGVVILAIGAWRGRQAFVHGREVSRSEDIIAEPRRQMWWSGWPLRDPTGLQNTKMSLRAGELATKNVEEMKALDEASIYVKDRQNRRSSISSVGVTMVGMAATAYGLYSFVGGAITLQEALFLGAASGMFMARVTSFSDAVGSWITSRFFVEEACELKRAGQDSKKREEELPAHLISRWTEAPGVKLSDVSINALVTDRETGMRSYRPIIKGLNLEVRPGEFIAIIGKTGAGKTTLIKALLGIVPPSQGSLTIGSDNLADIHLSELRANTSYLPQMFWTYAGKSIVENIRVGTPIWEPDAEISGALKNSGLLDVMRENKFDPSTVIGAEFSNGRRLSGGETQLVALAASLAKNGKLMILDEPTSRLDPDAAQRVLQHIRELENITRIVVSHDMGLVRQCDRIVVLSKENGDDEASPGTVEAIGTHEELLLSSPTYQRFFQSQAGRFSDAAK